MNCDVRGSCARNLCPRRCVRLRRHGWVWRLGAVRRLNALALPLGQLTCNALGLLPAQRPDRYECCSDKGVQFHCEIPSNASAACLADRAPEPPPASTGRAKTEGVSAINGGFLRDREG